MRKLHRYLCLRSLWYAQWHTHPFHHHVHIGIAGIALLVALSFIYQTKQQLVTASDFSISVCSTAGCNPGCVPGEPGCTTTDTSSTTSDTTTSDSTTSETTTTTTTTPTSTTGTTTTSGTTGTTSSGSSTSSTGSSSTTSGSSTTGSTSSTTSGTSSTSGTTNNSSTTGSTTSGTSTSGSSTTGSNTSSSSTSGTTGSLEGECGQLSVYGVTKVALLAAPKEITAGETVVLSWSIEAKRVTGGSLTAVAEHSTRDLYNKLSNIGVTHGSFEDRPVETTQYLLSIESSAEGKCVVQVGEAKRGAGALVRVQPVAGSTVITAGSTSGSATGTPTSSSAATSTTAGATTGQGTSAQSNQTTEAAMVSAGIMIDRARLIGEVLGNDFLGKLTITYGNPPRNYQTNLRLPVDGGRVHGSTKGMIEGQAYSCQIEGLLTTSGEIAGNLECQIGEQRITIPLTGQIVGADEPTLTGPLGNLLAQLLPKSVVNALLAVEQYLPVVTLAGLLATGPILPAVADMGRLMFLGYAPRRKRRPWGQVVDSALLPVSGAMIQLGSITKGRIVASQVTDSEGRFSFLVPQAGQYVIRVLHPHYQTVISEMIAITDPKQVQLNERLVLTEGALLPRRSRFKRLTSLYAKLHLPLILLGTLVNGMSVFLYGNTGLSLGLFVLYSALLGIVLLTWRYPRSFGKVSSVVGSALPLAFVRAVTIIDGRPVIAATTVSDQQGRYQLLLKPGEYLFVASKSGFERKQLTATITKRKIPAIDLALSPQGTSA